MDPTVPVQGIPGRSWSRRRGWFWPAALLVALLVTLPSASPGRAAAEIPAAQVEVDGTSLFQVRSSKDFSAEQRADAANDLLQRAARNPRRAELQVVERNGLPVISLDGKPLLTVTRLDAAEGLSPQDQAETWRRRLGEALEQGRLQRQPAYIRRMGLRSLALLLGALLLQRLLGSLFRRAFPQAWPHPGADGELIPGKAGSGFLIRALLRSLQVAVWISVAGTVADLFPLSRMALQRLRDALSDSLASPFLPLGERSYSVLDVIVLITLFLALARGLGVLQRLLRTRVLQYTGIGKGAQEGIAFVVQYALLFIGSLVLLQLWGLDLSSLTLFASVFGVALGLGLQGITKNFISGLIIIFERPIQVGDFVEIGELQGTVQKISLRSTEVVTLDRIAIIVPNAEFLESQVVNWSHGSPTSRLMLPIGVAYGSDCTAVRNALVEACKDYSGILQEPKPKVFFTGFGDSSLNFSLLVWINQPMRQYEIISDLNFRIEAVLRHRGISVPFPQRDLHLRNDSLQLSLPPELSEGLRALLADRGECSAAPPDQDGA
ncbi:mechanosensitive ion channel [Synechococcus sp. Cruz-9H2]|uniref:mechanosensitive ion channel family protein n=1 Tax=unclassified Synechococcus TaxID=2626047 RepID=UPI0020CD150B|nr:MULTISPECIES: mechanosensitive ion channel domain-containing protein [unclassified Synechococcus]MCP9819803.1 mechanosensitive ion channel [Synechococcus sp. Cruz-9H2]MCP9844131.1 mechanosensitive ion channel [Synechococcus sp. Edmonson 11F2]MCP9856233.1 mechanosensitive ion channel [Synechococcus sp. Cruz-9C9]MCP9863518.1 mechanosensitive ion channel [Synechococcus sp. Cruz-7E5]MCP9870714.1 mechanosensitive ion channel [Synechococcus sp. Cruz-7B9]